MVAKYTLRPAQLQLKQLGDSSAQISYIGVTYLEQKRQAMLAIV